MIGVWGLNPEEIGRVEIGHCRDAVEESVDRAGGGIGTATHHRGPVVRTMFTPTH
jgi:hypothetical protein